MIELNQTELEKAKKELQLALTMLVKVFEKTEKTPQQQKFHDGAKKILQKHFKPSDILR